VSFVVFFALCGLGAFMAAFLVGRYLWREEQRGSAVLVGGLTVAVGAFCFASAWVWWEGVLF